MDIDYCFWPKLKNMRELDVGLLLNFNDEKYLFIGIEAKYFSGTSDWENVSDAVVTKLTGNQIADHVQGINEMSADEILKLFGRSLDSGIMSDKFGIYRIYIFLTAHMVFPISDFEYADKHLDGYWSTPSYWLSWNFLPACLKPYQDQLDKRTNYLISDLYNLIKRKELIPFDGFKMAPWFTNAIAPNFWFENWFLQQEINISTYKSFLKNYRFQILPITDLPRGSFWKEVTK